MRIPRLWQTLAGTALLVAAVGVLPACATPRGRVYVRIAPPPPIVETVVVAPGPGYVWVPGYYRWSGTAYVWVPGAWVRPPRPRAVWVPGHWVHDRRGWFFVEGRWR